MTFIIIIIETIFVTYFISIQFPTSSRNFQGAQTSMNHAAEDLNIAASDIVGASRSSPEELSQASANYSRRFTQLLDAGMNMAGQAKVKMIL